MSQSNEHYNLVIQTTKALEARYPGISLVNDVQECVGDPIPPVINRFRPDIYGGDKSGNLFIIAEAKTGVDLDRNHTDAQINAFLDYLEQKEKGIFVLAVTGYHVDRAKTLLRFKHMSKNIQQTRLMVFDTLDFWCLDFDKTGIYRWLLT